MTVIICSVLFAHSAFGHLCLLYIWTHKRQAIWCRLRDLSKWYSQ